MTFKQSTQGGIRVWADGARRICADRSGVMCVLSHRRAWWFGDDASIMTALPLLNADERQPVLEAWAHHLASAEEPQRESIITRETSPVELPRGLS
jgi:hypothetical protein